MKSFIKFLFFLGIGVGILYFVYQNQEAAYQLGKECDPNKYPSDNLWDYVVTAFSQTNLFWLLMVCVAFMVSNISRALRWNLLIEPLGYKPRAANAFFATMVGYFINLALPRAGEIAKPATLAKYEKIPVDKLIGTIVADRVFDVIMLLLMIGLTFLLQFQHLYNFLFGEKVPVTCVTGIVQEVGEPFPWLTVFLVLVAIGVLTLSIIFIKWNAIKETAFFQKVKALALNFYAGMKTVFELRRGKLVQFLIHTVVIWFMYYIMMYICFWAYEPTSELSALTALLVFVFGAFGIVIPSPGGIGTYQLAVTAGLIIYAVPGPQAFAFSNIIFFTINIFCNVLFGFLAYILLPIYNKGYEPTLPTTKE